MAKHDGGPAYPGEYATSARKAAMRRHDLRHRHVAGWFAGLALTGVL